MLSRLLGAHWLGLETPRHLTNFSPSGLRTAIERSGLRVERISTSASGARQVALFSISRARGDPHAVFTNDLHRFPVHRRVAGSGLAAVERLLCLAGSSAGEVVHAVARA
jgi:hypothetical protein